jgi:hypothetical protein
MWSSDGRALFYRSRDRLLSVAIRTEPSFIADPPRLLFAGPYVSSPAETGRANYDVAPNSRSFVMVRSANNSEMHLHVARNRLEQLNPYD